jgi:tripartite-type tricarboxylate transporter receptor subunit TctC
MAIDNVPNILAQVRAGAVRALATATEARLPQLPDVPTTAEAGLPALRFGTWFGLVAPPGTPAAVTQRLSAAADEALRDPEIGGRLAEQGAVPGGGTPADFGRFMEAERAKLEPVVRGSGMRAD